MKSISTNLWVTVAAAMSLIGIGRSQECGWNGGWHFRDVRHNYQGKTLRPTVGSDGSHRQSARTRNHTTDREPGNAFFEFGRKRAEVG